MTLSAFLLGFSQAILILLLTNEATRFCGAVGILSATERRSQCQLVSLLTTSVPAPASSWQDNRFQPFARQLIAYLNNIPGKIYAFHCHLKPNLDNNLSKLYHCQLSPHSNLYTDHSNLYTDHSSLCTDYSNLYTDHSYLYTDWSFIPLHRPFIPLHRSFIPLHRSFIPLHRSFIPLHRLIIHTSTQTIHTSTQIIHTFTQKFHTSTQTIHTSTQIIHHSYLYTDHSYLYAEESVLTLLLQVHNLNWTLITNFFKHQAIARISPAYISSWHNSILTFSLPTRPL